MSTEFTTLLVAAAFIGVTHTLLGPDHYLPFVALQKSRRWTHARTISITAVCGIGHVLGSVVLGMVGLSFSLAVGRLEAFEAWRGGWTAWLLVGFGLAYLAWGAKRALKDRRHTHFHVHADGTAHRHEHSHHGDHAHIHEQPTRSLTFWGLFIIFVFGPCEALIPLLMYPAAEIHWSAAAWVAAVFAAATVGTMCGAVYLIARGLEWAPGKAWQRWNHALAGSAIAGCGLLIHFGL